MKKVLLGCLVVAGLVFSSCKNGEGTDSKSPNATAQQDIGEVLATVNGLSIGSKEFDEEYQRSVPRKNPGDPEGDATADKKEVMDKLIANKLLYQEALRQGLDQDARIQKMMINSLLRKDVYGSIKSNDIKDEEAKAYFDTHQDEFIVPEKVQVRRILIKVDADTPDADAKKKAEDVLKELTGGADFKDLAMKYSEDPYARRGGDMGFVAKEGKPGLDAVVVEKAFALEKGATSEVFKTDEGYNIVQAANKRERIERTFDQMRGAVLRKLKTEKYKELHDSYVANLKTKAEIKIHEDKVAAHKVPERSMPSFPEGGAGMPGGAPGMVMPGGAPSAPVPGGAEIAVPAPAPGGEGEGE